MNTTDPQLILRPLRRGVSNARKTVVSAIGAEGIISVSATELMLIERLAKDQPSLSTFLSKNLAGDHEMSFKQIIDLVVKLHRAGMFETTSETLDERLKQLAAADPSHTRIPNKGFLAFIANIANIELLSMRHVRASEQAASFFGRVATPVGVGCAAAIVLLGGFTLLSEGAALAKTFLEEVFAKPESFLLQAILSIAGAINIVAILQALSAFGAGATFVHCRLKLIGLCLPVLTVDDDQVYLTSRRSALSHFLLTLLAAPLCSIMIWLTSGFALANPLGLLAAGFGFATLVYSCPFIRSPIIKMSELLLLELNVLAAANRYLAEGLLADLVRLLPVKKDSLTHVKSAQARNLDIWTAFHATFTLVWLYGVSLLFLDLLIASVPELLYRVGAREVWSATAAAGFILFSLALAFLAVTLQLTKIIVQNICSVSATPLRKARRNLADYRSTKIPVSEAVTNFLRAIPILSHIEPPQLQRLTELLVFSDYKPGQNIVTQGEEDDRFFIMAVGEAKITSQGEDGVTEYIDTVRAGDSFGEIALIQNVTRQASVQAMTPCRVLVLKTSSFDLLFKPGSTERETLTEFINYSRLIQESQALSYLTPAQIHQFVHRAKAVNFGKGEVIISEGIAGEEAFLIVNGQAKVVVGESKQFLASLSRGDLFGMIALVKSIPRTATVIAETDMTCLQVDKATFVQLCMENLYVGALISELSDQQLAELYQQQEAG